MADARLILPPCDFSDDQEFLEWLETCRLIGIKAADELDEAAAYVYAKLRRYAMYEGIQPGPAKRLARSVALPIERGAGNLERFAGHSRLAARRLEAFLEAMERPRERRDPGFKVRGR